MRAEIRLERVDSKSVKTEFRLEITDFRSKRAKFWPFRSVLANFLSER